MGRFASEKYAMGISDRSGAAYKLKDMRKEWTGMLVGKDEWEAKQPQLTVVATPADPQALRNPRPDRTEPAVTVLLAFNPFTSGSSGFEKAVVHSLRNHIYNALGSNAFEPLNQGDRWLLSLPLYHVGGLAIFFRILISGAAMVSLPKKGQQK